jgi:uridylate kinase
MESATPAYKRIVLKLSGEALRETGGRDTISPQIVKEIARQVKEVFDLGVQISIVVGGGNIWRGLRRVIAGWIVRTADYMGMLATVINGSPCRASSSKRRSDTGANRDRNANVAEPFILRRAVRHLEQGRVVIFVAGTGNPYFSTDTTAALRGQRNRRRHHPQGDQG